MSIIKINNLSTKFKENVVHDNISFSINQGEIFGILGGSGSGKTTLLRQIVMLQKIQKGSIEIFDKNISKLSLNEVEQLKKEYSYLFQFGALYSFLNVIENIGVMLKEYTNLPLDLIDKIAFTHLNMVGLPSKSAFLYPSELSGGMKKRVALARALAMQPKILFLDEPTSGLDPSSTQKFNALIKELKEVLNLTVVIITHDLDTITQVLDRFVLLNQTIAFEGSVQEALQSDDAFVKEFLTQKKE